MYDDKKFCPEFTCFQTIVGRCPIALSEEFEEYGVSVPKNCNECLYNTGRCIDCNWYLKDGSCGLVNMECND